MNISKYLLYTTIKKVINNHSCKLLPIVVFIHLNYRYIHFVSAVLSCYCTVT